MMFHHKTGGPAFPHEYKYGDGTAHRHDGMTLRDWFAGQAMKHMSVPTQGFREMNKFPYEQMARIAYRWADAMIKIKDEA